MPPRQESGEADSAPTKERRFVAVLKFIAWLLAGILGPVTPWFQPLFHFELISDYFRPTLNPVAALLAVFAFAISYTLLKDSKADRLKRSLWLPFGVAFGTSFLICLVLSHTVGEVWEPGVTVGAVLRVVWILLYLSIFMSLSGLLAVLGLLFVGKK
jgi:hypothetical protein